MKNKILFVFAFIFLIPASSWAWELYDRAIATVNAGVVIESDVELKFNAVKKTKNIPKTRINYEKSRILDQFIEDELVNQNAEEAAIIVTDNKVMTRLRGMLTAYLATKLTQSENEETLADIYSKQLIAKVQADRNGSKQPKIDERLQGFIEQVQRSQNQSFKDFFEEVKNQILRQDFLSISLGVSPPTEEEAKRWFSANRSKLGEEMWVKHILIIPKDNSFGAERDANTRLSEIRKRIMAGESFERMAIQYSQDPGSASQGGDLGWIMPMELDPYFAGNVFGSYSKGSVTQIFKSGFGYHIAKYYGRRSVTFEKLYPMIAQKLYYEKIADQFQKWVSKKKQESEINIYMESYVSR